MHPPNDIIHLLHLLGHQNTIIYSFNSNLIITKTAKSMKDDAMFTSCGHLYGQRDPSLNNEEPGIINRK
jgi:hypothetical protein